MYWGMFDASRQAKFAWTGVVSDPDHWKVGAVAVRNVTPAAGEAQVVIVAKDGTDLIGAAKAEWGKWVVENGMWVTTDCVGANDLISGK